MWKCTMMENGGMSKIEEPEIRKISPKFINDLTSQEGVSPSSNRASEKRQHSDACY